MAFLAIFSTFAVGCTEDKEADVLTLSKEALTFPDAGELTQTIEISSNIEWTAVLTTPADKSWVTITPDKGNASGNISVTVTENPGAAREATITIGTAPTVRSLKITQTLKGVTTIDKSNIVFEVTGGLPQEITVTANVDWAVEFDVAEDKEWLTVTPMTGTENGKFTVAAKPNAGDVRTATLSIGTAKLTVSQKSDLYNVIGFEDIELDPTTKFSYGTMTSEDEYSKYYESTIGGFKVATTYEIEWDWNGHSFSSNTNNELNNKSNDYSVYSKAPVAGKGGASGSEKFMVVKQLPGQWGMSATSLMLAEGVDEVVDHLYVNNTTNVALTALNGSINEAEGTGRAPYAEGDYLELVINGYPLSGDMMEPIVIVLVDYREGKTFVMQDWTKVSLVELGAVNSLEFRLGRCDDGLYDGATSPTFCIDDIAVLKAK